MSFPKFHEPFVHPQNRYWDPDRLPSQFVTDNDFDIPTPDPFDSIFPPLPPASHVPPRLFFPISFHYIDNPNQSYVSSFPFAGLFGHPHRSSSPAPIYGKPTSNIQIDWTQIDLSFIGYKCVNNTITLHPTLLAYILPSMGLAATPSQISIINQQGPDDARCSYLEMRGQLTPTNTPPTFKPPTLIGSPHTHSYDYTIKFDWCEPREQLELVKLLTLGASWADWPELSQYITIRDWNHLRISVTIPGFRGFQLISNIALMIHTIYTLIS